jgi:hypothetical protein
MVENLKVFCFLWFLFFTLGCGKDKTSEIPPPGEPVNYEEHIQPIFDRSCVTSGCHNSDKAGGLDLSSGKSYSNLVNVPSQNYPPFLRVKAGSPDSSVLYNKLVGNPDFGERMPVGGNPLPQEELDLIRRWIEEIK